MCVVDFCQVERMGTFCLRKHCRERAFHLGGEPHPWKIGKPKHGPDTGLISGVGSFYVKLYRRQQMLMHVRTLRGCERICHHHCEPTGPRKARPNDRLREAIHS